MSFHQIFSGFYRAAAKKMCQDCKDFVKEGSKVLDLGCGNGIVAREFQKFFKAEIFGIDIKDQRIEKIPFKIFDGFKIPFPEDYFDLVLICYVLHHAKDPVLLLKEAKRVSKKIIIFEDLPEGFFAKLRCAFHQMSYNLFFEKEKKKFNFKKKREWEKIFEEIGMKKIFSKRVSAPIDLIDPVYRMLFVLEKT
jgi:ubiquinone/menaquinone biosynthesis C-methylase UbiE